MNLTLSGSLATAGLGFYLALMSCDLQAEPVAESPLLIPELFGAHLATDSDNRHSALAFSPSGKELFYSVYVGNQQPQKIFFSKRLNGNWSQPVVAPFSGIYKDGQPVFSVDGKRIYFYSKRPRHAETVASENYDIWYVERTGDGWGVPVNPGQPINTDDDEDTYTFTKNGDFYFYRQSEGPKRLLLKSRLVDGAFQTPEIIKEVIDPASFAKPVAIDGEDYFILTNNVKKGRFYYPALFISYKNKNGSWTRPKDMGDMINFGEGRFPSLSPDGKYLYFVSYRTGIAQFYRVDTRVIDYLKSEDLDLTRQLKTIVLDTDVASMMPAYEMLRQKHAKYYRFDETLFNQVASELVAADATDKAIDVYRLNFELYPQLQFYPQKLIVSLLSGSDSDFNHISDLIISETRDKQLQLHDKINSAGEVFLLKKRTAEAIRIF